MKEHKTAGQLSHKALSDTTKYDALEVAYGSTDDVLEQLLQSAHTYADQIDQVEYCIVMVIASDPLIVNLRRRKFYCWPWLPSPRPNQGVWLYNKVLDRIVKRLWVLPCPEAMAILATPGKVVDPQYQTMQNWSRSFYKGKFWEDIRDEHKINMLSQQEEDKLNPEKEIKTDVDGVNSNITETFDFSKIVAGQVEHSGNTIAMENG